jgi:hypothetical protein
MKLTQEAIGRLRLPAGKNEAIYFDDQLPGFGVRLRAAGSKKWSYNIESPPRAKGSPLSGLSSEGFCSAW